MLVFSGGVKPLPLSEFLPNNLPPNRRTVFAVGQFCFQMALRQHTYQNEHQFAVPTMDWFTHLDDEIQCFWDTPPNAG